MSATEEQLPATAASPTASGDRAAMTFVVRIATALHRHGAPSPHLEALLLPSRDTGAGRVAPSDKIILGAMGIGGRGGYVFGCMLRTAAAPSTDRWVFYLNVDLFGERGNRLRIELESAQDQPTLRLVDATGQTFQPGGPRLDWRGWRPVTIRLRRAWRPWRAGDMQNWEWSPPPSSSPSPSAIPNPYQRRRPG
jgi:hypothetical protein